MLEDSFNKEKTWPIKWWAALSFCISAYLLSIILTGLFSNLIGDNTTTKLGFLYMVSATVLLICSALFLGIKRISLKHFFGRLALRQLILVPIFFFVYVALSKIAQSIIGLLPGVNVNQSQDFGLESNSIAQLVIIFFALVILPAISEEILFRGFLYRSFKKPFGKVLAAVAVSLLFGIAHGQWNVAADTFVLSLVLVYLVEKYNSLWPAILLHFLKNFIAFLLVFVFHVA